jgi:hypothetical protein
LQAITKDEKKQRNKAKKWDNYDGEEIALSSEAIGKLAMIINFKNR